VLCVVSAALYFRSRRADQQALADVTAHGFLLAEAADHLRAYRERHPTASLAEVERLDQLDAETKRLVVEQSQLVSAFRSRATLTPVYESGMAMSAVLPVTWLMRRSFQRARQKSRRARGLCTECGYDLRASKDRCPECGTAIGAAAARPRTMCS